MFDNKATAEFRSNKLERCNEKRTLIVHSHGFECNGRRRTDIRLIVVRLGAEQDRV